MWYQSTRLSLSVCGNTATRLSRYSHMVWVETVEWLARFYRRRTVTDRLQAVKYIIYTYGTLFTTVSNNCKLAHALPLVVDCVNLEWNKEIEIEKCPKWLGSTPTYKRPNPEWQYMRYSNYIMEHQRFPLPQPHGTCKNQKQHSQVQRPCGWNKCPDSITPAPTIVHRDIYSARMKTGNTRTYVMRKF